MRADNFPCRDAKHVFISPMTDEELRVAQAKTGCTGKKISEWLGVSNTTFSRWRCGAMPIPGPAALAIQALSDGWRPKA